MLLTVWVFHSINVKFIVLGHKNNLTVPGVPLVLKIGFLNFSRQVSCGNSFNNIGSPWRKMPSKTVFQDRWFLRIDFTVLIQKYCSNDLIQYASFPFPYIHCIKQVHSMNIHTPLPLSTPGFEASTA